MTPCARPLALAALAVCTVAGPGAAASPYPDAAPAETGTIFSVAGTGFFSHGQVTEAPPVGDAGPAGLAPLDSPGGVAALPGGGYLVADTYGNRIRRVSAQGVITTVAGTGREGATGDGGPATRARLNHPAGAVRLADGAIAIADQRNNLVRLVDPLGTIRTLAAIRSPSAVAAAPDGGVLVADPLDSTVVHVDRAGVVTPFAGSGTRGYAGDGGPATAARISRVTALDVTADGAVLIADGSGHVRRVGTDGVITTAAVIPRVVGVAAEPGGGILATSINRVLRVRPDGTIVTVAGNGPGRLSGDAGPALDAGLWLPRAVAPAAGGGVLVADTSDGRIRFIAGASPGPAAIPAPPRVLGASFRRVAQPGFLGSPTLIRVSCPPRSVAVRFAVSETAGVTLRVTHAGVGREVLRARARPGLRTVRFTVRATGLHRLLLRATARGRVAVDQAQLNVSACPAR